MADLHASLPLPIRPQRWCDEYAKLYFADGMVWGPDPELTPLGLAQAADVAAAWAAEIRDGGARAVLPRVLWTSPLKRAAMTLAISYGDVLLSGPGAPQPVIKEVSAGGRPGGRGGGGS